MIKVKVNNEYKDVVKIFGGGALQKEIIKVWSREAQEYVYESSVEYTGSLPITISTNGDALLDYKIYGASGGVGEVTENLFDKTQYVTNYISGKAIVDNGEEITAEYNGYSTYTIPVTAGETYTLKGTTSKLIDNYMWLSRVYFLNGQKQFVRMSDPFFDDTSDSIYRFTVPNGITYIELQMCTELTYDDVMLVEGSTAPTSYIPYGYRLPMVISDGNTDIDIPVYIGDSQLEEDEYVDYGEQTVYKRTINLFNKDTAIDGYEILGSSISKNPRWYISDFIPVQPGVRYKANNVTNAFLAYRSKDDTNPERGNGIVTSNGVLISSDFNFIIVNALNTVDKGTVMLTKLSEFPAEYIPHVAPTDPPVPLPEIPTIDRATVIDCDLATKPSQMYIKYRR